jgi:hypothetical protein
MVKYRFEIVTMLCIILLIGSGFILKMQIQEKEKIQKELFNVKKQTLSPVSVKMKKKITFPLSRDEAKYFFAGLFPGTNITIKHAKEYVSVEIYSKKEIPYVDLMSDLTQLEKIYNVIVKNLCIGQDCPHGIEFTMNVYPKIQKGGKI